LEKKTLANYPRLLKEWNDKMNAELEIIGRNGKNIILPSDIPAQSHKKVWWICEKGHEWPARIQNRTTQQSNCPYCTNRKANLDNCLQTTHPEIAKQWHPEKNVMLSPLDVTYGSHKKVWWLCKNGHEWQATTDLHTQFYIRTNGNNICKACNSLAFCNPELAKQWHPTLNDLTPEQVSEGSNRRVWWICKQGHEWYVPVYSRAKDGDGCRKCYSERQGEMRRKLSVRKAGSIADTNPELAKQWHPTKNTFLSNQLSHGSKISIWWVCKKGHEWKQVIRDVTRNYSRSKTEVCKYCTYDGSNPYLKNVITTN